MDLSWVKCEAWPDKSTTVGCMSCPATSGHCHQSPPPTSEFADSRWQPPCFIQCWHSECHRRLSPLAFVLSHSAVSRPVLGALNVGYMTDCFQRSERQKDKWWRHRGRGKIRSRRKERVLAALLVGFTCSSNTYGLSSGLTYASHWHSNQFRATVMHLRKVVLLRSC